MWVSSTTVNAGTGLPIDTTKFGAVMICQSLTIGSVSINDNFLT